MNRRPQLQIVAPGASPEEAAAVVAALEQFMRQHAPGRTPEPAPTRSGWQLASLREGVSRTPDQPPFWA